jgi:AcrR family transcriptional regulator
MPSREEKKAATRRRLLDAAAALVASQGAMATSLDAIAAKAGLTKGAVYSNFASKEDLLFALVDEAGLPVFDAEELFDPGRSLAENLEVLGERLAAGLSTVSQRDWQLALEILHFAQRNPRARRSLAEGNREGRKDGSAALAALAEQRGEPLPLAAEELNVVLNALAMGLALERGIDPDAVPDELFPKAFRLLAGPNAAAPAGGSPSAHRRGRR